MEFAQGAAETKFPQAVLGRRGEGHGKAVQPTAIKKAALVNWSGDAEAKVVGESCLQIAGRGV